MSRRFGRRNARGGSNSGAAAITPATYGVEYLLRFGDMAAGTLQTLTPTVGSGSPTQANASKRGTSAAEAGFNGQLAMTFDGTDDEYAVAAAVWGRRPRTINIVCNTVSGTLRYFCGQTFTVSAQYVLMAATSLRYEESALYASSATTTGIPCMLSISVDAGTGISFYRNGVAIGTGTDTETLSGTGVNFFLGSASGSGFWSGILAEMGVYPLMTTAQILAFYTGYAKPRYGI